MKIAQTTFAVAAFIALESSFPATTLAKGVLVPATGSAVGSAVAAQLRDKPLVVRVHAAWCAECQTTLPDFQAFTKKYGNKVSVIDLDVTDGKTSATAMARAAKAGLHVYFERTKTAPLTVGFIDPNAGTVVAELRGNVDLRDLVTAERATELSLAHR